jgi:hypothetical protein
VDPVHALREIIADRSASAAARVSAIRLLVELEGGSSDVDAEMNRILKQRG